MRCKDKAGKVATPEAHRIIRLSSHAANSLGVGVHAWRHAGVEHDHRCSPVCANKRCESAGGLRSRCQIPLITLREGAQISTQGLVQRHASQDRQRLPVS